MADGLVKACTANYTCFLRPVQGAKTEEYPPDGCKITTYRWDVPLDSDFWSDYSDCYCELFSESVEFSIGEHATVRLRMYRFYNNLSCDFPFISVRMTGCSYPSKSVHVYCHLELQWDTSQARCGLHHQERIMSEGQEWILMSTNQAAALCGKDITTVPPTVSGKTLKVWCILFVTPVSSSSLLPFRPLEFTGRKGDNQKARILTDNCKFFTLSSSEFTSTFPTRRRAVTYYKADIELTYSLILFPKSGNNKSNATVRPFLSLSLERFKMGSLSVKTTKFRYWLSFHVEGDRDLEGCKDLRNKLSFCHQSNGCLNIGEEFELCSVKIEQYNDIVANILNNHLVRTTENEFRPIRNYAVQIYVHFVLDILADPEERVEDAKHLIETSSSGMTAKSGEHLEPSEFLEKLFNDLPFPDVVFVIEDREISAHKAVLALRSEVFRAMFNSNMKESQGNPVTIPDIKFDVFKELVRYVYTKQLSEEFETMAQELFVAADKYGLQELKARCERVLCANLNHEDAVTCLVLANMHSASKLKECAMDYIQENMREIRQMECWKMFKTGQKDLWGDVLEELASRK